MGLAPIKLPQIKSGIFDLRKHLKPNIASAPCRALMPYHKFCLITSSSFSSVPSP